MSFSIFGEQLLNNKILPKLREEVNDDSVLGIHLFYCCDETNEEDLMVIRISIRSFLNSTTRFAKSSLKVNRTLNYSARGCWMEVIVSNATALDGDIDLELSF